ncbi:MAG: hypothetical protein NW206_13720 [Hyphomonadaceae bacterium]|nr:hypothetical protein [Hyphomonadaceae bacterium]
MANRPAPPPVPRRIPPLGWRQPVLVWTPAALLLALGWPALMLRGAPSLMHTALIGGAIVFAMSFVTLGGAWLMGRAPRTHRDVMQHFIIAGFIVSLCAPFVLTALLDSLAEYHERATGLRGATAFAMTPLAILLGLPIAFFYGLTFSLVALVKQPREGAAPRVKRGAPAVHDVQPFA